MMATLASRRRTGTAALAALLLLGLGVGSPAAQSGPSVSAYRHQQIRTYDETGQLTGMVDAASLPAPPVRIVAWGRRSTVAIALANGEWVYLPSIEVTISGLSGLECRHDPNHPHVCAGNPTNRGIPYCPGDVRCRGKKKPPG